MLAEQTPASFIAFDLLALGDEDYTGRPFAERRAALEQALAGARPPIHLTPTTTDLDVAQRWFVELEGAGLDGVIAKPLDGTYQPDKRVMFKIKHVRTADCVLAGFRWHKTSTEAAAAGRLAAARASTTTSGKLQHVGVVGAFTAKRRAELVDELEPLLLGDGDDHPWQEWAERRGAPGPAAARQRQPLERDQGPVVRAAAARSGCSR